MRLVLSTLLLAVVSTATFAQDTKKEDALKGDLAKIQGKWSAKVGPNKDIPITVAFKDQTATILITIEGEERTIKGEFKLDETKSPKQWDWTKFESPTGEKVPENLAIYKVEGDKLTICSGGPGNAERPKEFKEGEGGPPNLVEFTKVKEEPKKDK
jgi:uncharacterized protein (TIGR03067 family)